MEAKDFINIEIIGEEIDSIHLLYILKNLRKKN